jgi:hypothetical protein
MGQTTGIGWTDHTFNPWMGCQRISPACGGAKGVGGCYAEALVTGRMGYHAESADPRRRLTLWGPLVISADERAAKKAREGAALTRLVNELGDGSWLAALLFFYEEQREPEARFVRLVDKILPKLTHATNGCVAAMPLTDRAGFIDAHARQLRALSEEYPEFPDALELLRASMLHAEECWQTPKSGAVAQ